MEEFELRFDEPAERAVLGSMIIKPEFIPLALSKGLKEEDFFLEEHRKLFRLLIDLYQVFGENWAEIELFELARKENIEIARDLVMAIAQEGTSSEILFENALKVVKEYSTLNTLKEYALKLLKAQTVESAQKIKEELINFKDEYLEIKDFKKLLNAFVEKVKKAKESERLIAGMETGFLELDTLTLGFEKGSFILVGARPGMGKSSFMLSMAMNMAKAGKKVVIFSLEMSANQCLERMSAILSGVELRKIRTGMLSQEDWGKFIQACLELDRMGIVLDDAGNRTTLEIRSIAQLEKADVVFIDYLQLITPFTKKQSRQEEVAEISRTLKLIAKDLNIPVVALVQLSRQTEHRSDRRPTLADIRETGQTEQDADIVMFLYRPEYYKKNPPPEEVGIAEVIVAKNRQGRQGTVKLRFDKDTTGFFPLESPLPVGETAEEKEELDLEF